MAMSTSHAILAATERKPPSGLGWAADPRLWHLPALAVLLAYGVFVLDFEQPPVNIAVILTAALLTQWLCGYAVGAPRFDPLSALATALSLSLLLRASSPAVLALAGVIAIAQKFVIRIDGKHVFNPSCFAIAALLLMDAAWISPAQWGSKALAAFFFAGLAGLVLSRAKRTDIALAFLAAYAAILLGRAFYLGDPLAIPLKQMQSGALLLFAFFMITDPKTVPDRRAARLFYAVLVAIIAAWLQFGEYNPNGLIYALFFASPLVPLLDRLYPHRTPRFEWTRPNIN
jgi:Na+-transporting NADH:ubiquinone oxidoreductase subunit NqrB